MRTKQLIILVALTAAAVHIATADAKPACKPNIATGRLCHKAKPFNPRRCHDRNHFKPGQLPPLVQPNGKGFPDQSPVCKKALSLRGYTELTPYLTMREANRVVGRYVRSVYVGHGTFVGSWCWLRFAFNRVGCDPEWWKTYPGAGQTVCTTRLVITERLVVFRPAYFVRRTGPFRCVRAAG